MDRDIPIAELVAAARAQTPKRTDELARRCWPGGFEDRVVPAAVEWVRRWRPSSVVLTPRACACATGRCAVCN